MALYIMAMTINPNAKKDRGNLSTQINRSFDVFEKHGVKVREIFATLGRFDYLALFDATDQTLAFSVASEINSRGILDTETWPVIPYDDFTRLL